jgi:hypothetical protein
LGVTPEGEPFADGTGAAVRHDPTTAIAIVTSQPGQFFRPFSDAPLKMLGIPQEKVFENTAKRLFYASSGEFVGQGRPAPPVGPSPPAS